MERSQFLEEAPAHTSLVEARVGPIRILVPPSDPWIGRQTFLNGGFGRAQMEAIVGYATDALGTSPIAGRTFVDVGANIGTTSLYAALLFGARRVVSIEPQSENVRVLRANLALNDLSDKAEVLAAGASDRRGTMVLDQATRNIGDHWLLDADAGPVLVDDHPGQRSTVPAVRLDDLLLRCGRVGMIWVDTQGHDARVLNGGWRMAAVASAAVIEYWPLGLGHQDGLARFERVVAAQWPLFVDAADLLDEPRLRSTSELPALVDRYPPDGSHTDLLLLRPTRRFFGGWGRRRLAQAVLGRPLGGGGAVRGL